MQTMVEERNPANEGAKNSSNPYFAACNKQADKPATESFFS